MRKITYKLIIPTYAAYFDICENFLELLKINWPEALSQVVLSVVGNSKCDFNTKKFPEITYIKNKKNTTLTKCIYNVSQKFKADFYFVFLGDALITHKLNNSQIVSLLKVLKMHNIEYCKLVPQVYLKKNKTSQNSMYRCINSNERYAFSFVAFIANSKFISDEFSDENVTDRDFEIKYLKLASQKQNILFRDKVILKKNFFGIMPSIQKGKWDAINIKKLKKKYPNVRFSNRSSVNLKYELILKIREKILPFIPDKIRVYLKSKYKNSEYFDTEL